MIHQSVKRELVTGITYLLIGLLALAAAFRWFGGEPPVIFLLAWIAVAVGLSLIRFLLLFASEWFRRDQWRSVSRRRDW